MSLILVVPEYISKHLAWNSWLSHLYIQHDLKCVGFFFFWYCAHMDDRKEVIHRLKSTPGAAQAG